MARERLDRRAVQRDRHRSRRRRRDAGRRPGRSSRAAGAGARRSRARPAGRACRCAVTPPISAVSDQPRSSIQFGRLHAVPIDVVGTRAADERRLDETPAVGARQIARARIEQGEIAAVGIGDEPHARRRARPSRGDQRQPLVAVRRLDGARRAESAPTHSAGAPGAGVHRDRVHAIAAVRGRRHVVERAEDRRPLARVVDRSPAPPASAPIAAMPIAATGSARAGSPSTAASAA